MPTKTYLADDGTRISYHIHRAKKPDDSFSLLFLHGWLANWTEWKQSYEFFKQQGCTVLAPDLRGHGRSGRPQEKQQYLMQHFVDDLKGILKKERLSRVIIVGHSMGGMIALHYAGRYPRTVRALALCSTTHTGVLKGRALEKFTPLVVQGLDALLRRVKNNKKVSDVDLSSLKTFSDYFRALSSVRAIDARAALSCLESMIYHDSKTLNTLTAPLLVVHGAKDMLIPKEAAALLKKKATTFVIIPDAGHPLNITHADLFNKTLLRFLNGLQE